jgi:hypothetical protein
MRKVLALAVMTGFVLAVSSAADARGGGHGFGGFGSGGFSTPGQRFINDGSITGYPGASGYAPGRRMRMDGRSGPGYTDETTDPPTTYPGATYWTPRNNLGFPAGN